MASINVTAAVKASKKVSNKVKAIQSLETEKMLKDIPVTRVTLNKLIPTEMNVRKRQPDTIKLVDLAQSIKSLGILQNLVVFDTQNGLYGVAAGGRRLAALKMLCIEGVINADYLVPVKIVDKERASLISLAENGLREDMHPADQLVAFRQLSADGHSVSGISGLMGFNTKHVQKCLRLANMPSLLLEALAADEINLDQLQALSASGDHDRQLNVWANATENYQRRPDSLRQEVLRGEVSAYGNARLNFVSREEYERRGGTFRQDLFTDEGFISDPVLLDRLLLDKLGCMAADIAKLEGWSWSEGRENRICTYGEDAEKYALICQPELVLKDEDATKKALHELKIKRLKSLIQIENSPSNAHDQAIAECECAIEQIDTQAVIDAWPTEVKSEAGVVAYLDYGVVAIRRGVKLRILKIEQPDSKNSPLSSENSTILTIKSPPHAKSMSSLLVRSLSSERTLAVQAALAQQPYTALVIFVHDCMKSVFSHYSCARSTMRFTLHRNTHTLVDNASTGADSLAMQTLNIMHDTWEEKLPEGWHLDWKWLMAWSNEELISVMVYCLAGTLDGVCDKLDGTAKAGGSLEPVERQLNFKLHDWWQPNVSNFFGRISKDTISDVLADQGNVTLAREVMKMKKGDAATVAANETTKQQWLPACMTWHGVENKTTDVENNILTSE